MLAALDLRRTLGALLSMLGPLLLLPLGSRWALGTLVPLGVLATSSSPIMQGLGLHYAAPIIGFLWIGAIDALGRLQDRATASEPEVESPGARPAWPQVVTICAAVALVSVAATRWSILYPRSYAGLDRRPAVQQMLNELPAEASVAAQSALVPHVPKRWGYQMLPEIEGMEFVLLDTALNPWPMTRNELEQLRDALLAGQFQTVAESGTAILLRRR